MTGPQHYAAGEHLIHKSTMVSMDDGQAQLVIAQAQAHFAAAQVAATLVASESGYSSYRMRDWEPILGPARQAPEAGPW